MGGKVKDTYTEVKEIADDILPEESEIRNSTYLIYVLSGSTGRVSEKYVRMVKENAAHRLIKEHIVAGKGTSLIGDDVYIFCENIWESVKSLIEKKVFIDIYPIKKCDDFYFLPKKMLCIKLHNNIENHSYSSKVFSSIDDQFPDVIGNMRSKLDISDEKYPNDAIDFSFMNPTSGGICIADDCQVEYDSYLFSSNEVRDRNVKVSSAKIFVDMLIKIL